MSINISSSGKPHDSKLGVCTQRSRRSLRKNKRRATVRPLRSGTETLEPRRVLAALLFNQTVNETLGTAGDIDQYEFSLATPTRVYLDTLGTQGSVNWTLERGSDPALFSQSNQSQSPVMDLAAGNYKLRFGDAGSSTVAYAFRLMNLSTSALLQDNVTNIDVLAPGSSTQAYRLSATTGDVFNFDTETPQPRSANWRLVGPLGNNIFDVGLGTDVTSVQATATGTYTLLVEGYYFDADTVDYQFKVNLVGNSPINPFPGTPLTLGNPVSADLAAASEVDAYSFTLTASTNLYVDTLSTGSQFQWSLKGPQGVMVGNRDLANDYYFSGSSIVWAAPAGHYQLTVGSSSNNTGNYSLRVLNLSSAPLIGVDTSVSGTLNPASSARAYRLPATAIQKLYLDTSASSTQNATWRMINPSGQTIAGHYLSTDLENISTTTAGDYTILLEGYADDTGETAYSFRAVSVIDGDTSLALNTPVASQLTSPGEVDTYRFTLASDTLVQFDTLVNLPNTHMILRDADGDQIDSRILENDWYYAGGQNTRLLPAGSYSLAIDGDNDRIGNYSFQLLSLANAQSVTPGTLVSSNLTPGAETDLYRFSATAGGQFYFNSHASSTNNALWRVIDSTGLTIASNYLYSDIDTLTLPLTGEYYLAVEGYYADPVANYSFTIQPIANVSPTPLVLDNTMASNIAVPGERDYYSFTLLVGKRVQFDGLTAQTPLKWKLERSDGAVLANRQFTSDIDYGGNASLDLVPATYTLSIDASEDAIGNYAFRLLDVGQAELITPGTPIARTLSPASETDLYRFAAVEGAYFYFDSLSNNTDNSYWRVLDPLGRFVVDNALSNDMGLIRANVTGNYTLLVEGYFFDTTTINYSFNLRSVSLPPPEALTLGTTYSNTLATPGQFRQYTFTINSTTIVLMDALTTPGDILWSLQGPTSVANSVNLTSDFGGSFYKLIPGTYTLTIDGSGDQIGNYAFRLLDVGAATPITPGDLYSQNLNPPNQTDLYRFSAVAGDRFYFDSLIPPSHPFVGSTWRLMDPAGRMLFSTSVLGDIDGMPMPLTGEYTLAFEGYISETQVANYAFRIQPLSDAAPIALTFGNTYSGTVGLPGEADSYTFNVATYSSNEAQLHFDALTGVTGLNWSMYGPQGYIVVNQPLESLNTPWLQLQPGDYTLIIDGIMDRVGNYSFRLLSDNLGTPVSRNTPTASQLTPGGESDIHLLAAIAGEKFNFVGSASNPAGTLWQLIDPVGRSVFLTNAQATLDGVELSMTGDYRLLILGELNAAGPLTYQFEVDFVSFTPPEAFTGTAIDVGTPVSGNIANTTQQDSYIFTLTAPTKIVWDALSGDQYLDWTLTGPSGQVMQNLFMGDSYLFNVPLIPGDYQLVISGAIYSVTGNYSFQLLDFAAGTLIDTESLVSGQLSPPNETNLYHFTGTAGTKLYFDSKSTEFSGSYWGLFDPTGRLLANQRTSDDLELIQLTLTGTYTIWVYGTFDTSEPVNYAFRIQPVTVAPAVPLTFGDIINDAITVTGQQNRYSFSLSVDTLVTFDGLTTPDNFTWIALGPLGIDGFHTLDDEATVMLVKGDYELIIDASGDTTGPYSVRLLSPSVAPPTTPGTATSGTLTRGNQINLHRFTATAGQLFYFDSLTANDGGARWQVIDPLGRVLANDRLNRDLGTLRADVAGEYLVLVRGDTGTADGKIYDFKVQPLATSPSAPLSLGTIQSGTLSVPGERDTFTFNLTQEKTIYFDALSSPGGLSWQLSSPAGTSITSVPYESDTTNSGAPPFYKLAPGNYVLSVAADGDSTGNYQFQLLDSQVTTAISLSTLVNSSLSPGNETELFSFTASAGERLYLDGSLSGGSNHTWTILDPLGNRLAFEALSRDMETGPLAVTGRYMLVVEGYFYDTAILNYNFTVYSNSAPAPQAIALGATVTGNIAAPGQRQVFTFNLTEPHSVMFDTLSLASSNLNFSLVGPTGTIISARSLGSDYYYSSTDMPVHLLAGVYQVVIDGDGAELGAYQFRLFDLNTLPTLPFNETVSGALGPNRQTDAYAFVGTLGTKLYFNSQSSATQNSIWRLMDPQGKTIAASSLSSNLGPIELKLAGRYILTVESYAFDTGSIPYSLLAQIVDTEPANTTLAPAAVTESLPIGSFVGLLTTSDVNASSTQTYSLVSGAGDTDNNLFSIVNHELRTAATLDFEFKSNYSVRVRTTDNVGLLFDRVFTITVSNVNEAPSSINLSNATLVENSAANAVVGLVSGTDPDANDTLIFSLPTGLNDNVAFQLAGNSLRALATLDFETKPTYTVTLRATDSGGLSIDRDFTISIINLPELAAPVKIGDGTTQRSSIRQVVIDFDTDMIIDAGAFTIEQRSRVGGNPVFTLVTTQVDLSILPNGKTRATLSFSGSFTRAGGALIDGYYRLTIDSTKIHERSTGLELDGDRNGTAGGNYVLGNSETDNFFALFGDTDGDGIVGTTEFGEFRTTFGKSSSQGGYNPLFDFEADGNVGVSDYGQFRSRFTKPKLQF